MISLEIRLKKFFLKFKDKNFVKGISTLIGASCVNFLVGAIFSLCTLSVYEISYIKGLGGSIEIEHLTFYYPVEIFFQCISAFASGIMYKKLGLHKTNFIGVLILSFGYYLMYVSTNLKTDLISMIFGGVGTGIIFYPSTTNAYEWFKEHNGIIVGIMETMISFGSFFFAFIGEKIINKNEIPSNDKDNLYDLEIGKRIKIYLLIQIITLISAFMLSYILMFEKITNAHDYIFKNINNSELTRLEIKNEEEKDENPNSNVNLKDNTNSTLRNIIPIKKIQNTKIVKHVLIKNCMRKKNVKNNKKRSKILNKC